MGIGIQLMLLSGLAVALSNLCMRRSIDAGGTTKAYLMLQLALVVGVAILLGPVRTGDYAFSMPMVMMGLIGGLLLSGFMGFLGRALEHGPPGLTIAMLNCSTVMPILLLVLLFGGSYGFFYSWWNGIGSLLVVAGLCWAGWELIENIDRRKWLTFIGMAFGLHVTYLVFLQWRALFLNFPGSSFVGISLTPADVNCQWFMPMVFLTASIVQAVRFFSTESRRPNAGEVRYAVFGGITNGLGAFLLIRATEVATSFEQAMLFPFFSVTLIIVCNIWGRWLYSEKVNWRANSCCIAGLLIGTIDWAGLF